jgi:hypothetical protein
MAECVRDPSVRQHLLEMAARYREIAEKAQHDPAKN